MVKPKIEPLEAELDARSAELRTETSKHVAAKEVRDKYRKDNPLAPHL